MKVFGSSILAVAFAAITISTASADPWCARSHCTYDLAPTATAFEVGRQFANGGAFAGVSSRTTGTTIEIARNSMPSLDALEHVTFAWPLPPIVAQGD